MTFSIHLLAKYKADLERAEARIKLLEEKLRLAKLICWRETDETPITIFDVPEIPE